MCGVVAASVARLGGGRQVYSERARKAHAKQGKGTLVC